MRYLRACAACRIWFPPTHWLCAPCWQALEGEYLSYETTARAEKRLPHFRLMDWHKGNHLLMSRLIDSLKQGGPGFIFKRLGLEMFSRFMPCDLWGRNISPVFIPAPPNSPLIKDHAFCLAQALQFYFGGSLKSLLRKAPHKNPQKRKSRQQRAFIKIKAQEPAPAERPIIFVDDILTTGATARASFHALGAPKNFFIFTLAWRKPPKSAKEE